MTGQQVETRRRLLAEGWRELHGHQPAHWQFYESADGIRRVYVRIDGVVESNGGPEPIAPPSRLYS